MLAKLIRTTGLLGLLLAFSAPGASGATQKEIEQAIKSGTNALKARYGRAGGPGVGGDQSYGIGGTCLAGLAILEAKTPVNDPAVKTITETVRNASYTQTKTYQIALCLMYLDRLDDPADVPLIQMLAVRLLAGQSTTMGGWGYDCISGVTGEDEKRLRAMKADQGAGKMHPEVLAYSQALANARNQPVAGPLDDNSNTQFAVLAVWMARKRGVPVEPSLELIEKRFIALQDQRTGNWSYNGMAPGAQGIAGSPAMYCAGLLGMATAVGRREEKRKGDVALNTKPDVPPKKDGKLGDPFYNPPAGTPTPKKDVPARPVDGRDLVIQRAFAGLGLTLADQIRGGKLLTQTLHGYGDLYFLWSLERVGVIYGMDKIGGIDWYDVGSTLLVRSQSPDGTWAVSGYGAEINTSFAVLFLLRSNLARDLSSKVQKDPTSTEMRAGSGPSATDLLPNRPTTPAGTPPAPLPVINLPNPTNDEAITRASTMLKAAGADWGKLLAEARDGKGPNFTRALVLTATNSVDDRKKEAREALAERLCRMSAPTLRGMLKAEEAELRRAAALACAMKDDKEHVPDLIDALTDADDAVGRAAKAGLKSLTGKDFGPPAGASAGQKALAASAWKEWYAKEKK